MLKNHWKVKKRVGCLKNPESVFLVSPVAGIISFRFIPDFLFFFNSAVPLRKWIPSPLKRFRARLSYRIRCFKSLIPLSWLYSRVLQLIPLSHLLFRRVLQTIERPTSRTSFRSFSRTRLIPLLACCCCCCYLSPWLKLVTLGKNKSLVIVQATTPVPPCLVSDLPRIT